MGDAPYTGMLGRWTFNARSSEETGEKLVLRPGVCTWKPNVLTEFEAIRAFSRYRRLKDAPSGLASDPPPKSYQLGQRSSLATGCWPWPTSVAMDGLRLR